MRKKVSKDYISDVENFDKLPIYSKRIRNYLNENGITAKELNQKAGFASPSAVPELIKGTRDLSLDAAKKLCSVMNVSLDYLTGLTDVRTIDVKIRDICKYTGLSEKAIRIITGSEPVDVVNEYSKEDLKLLSDFLSDGALLLFLRDVDASRKSIEKAIRTSEKCCPIQIVTYPMATVAMITLTGMKRPAMITKTLDFGDMKPLKPLQTM